MAAQTQMSMQQLIANNSLNRQLLLQYGINSKATLTADTSGTLGGTTRIKLNNVGILTALTLKFYCNVDISVATASVAPGGIYNLIRRIRLQDYAGTSRLECTGIELWQYNCLRTLSYSGGNNQAATLSFPYPKVPTAIAAAQELGGYIDIPVCVDPFGDEGYRQKDLRGAINCQSATGEMYLIIDWAVALNGDHDNVYAAAGSTIALNGKINAEVVQHYIYPQPVNGVVPLPPIDLMTVHEVAGAKISTDNIAAGQEKYIYYPNDRNIMYAIFNYINGGVRSDDLRTLKLIANGNLAWQDFRDINQFKFDQRRHLNFDALAGCFMMDHRAAPIVTSRQGNVSAAFGINAVSAGNTHFGVLFASVYPIGSTLSAIQQGS